MESSDKFLSPCSIHIVDSNVIHARMAIYETQIRKYGGQLVRKPSADDRLTHVLVDDDLPEEKVSKIISNRFPNLLVEGGSETKVLRTKWLGACLRQKMLVDTAPYHVYLPKKSEEKPEQGIARQQKKRHSSPEAKEKGAYDQTTDDDSGSEDSAHSSQSTTHDAEPSSSQSKKPRFACDGARSSAENARVNHNKLITDKLKILADGYKSTNDQWRALSYEKAIKVLSRYPKPISSFDEVRNMRGIGQRLAEKIWEIHESGELSKADEFMRDEKIRTMNLFTNVFGVGPTVAEQWYAQGFRTLKDLEEKANLNRQQRIGLKYYDEILTRMDRSEAAEIVNVVIDAVKKLNPSLICAACGSFRRGCKTCGDVDIIITHPDGRSQEGVLAPLVKNLTDSGFLTDSLVECDDDGSHRKYMGVCKLPEENRKHRRIDIIAVPYSEYATSLIYFTGSVYFVRSIYAKAKYMGMRLNQHGLCGGVMRQGGEKLNDGYLIPTPTEESVFEKLGVQYRKPEERDLISFTADL